MHRERTSTINGTDIYPTDAVQMGFEVKAGLILHWLTPPCLGLRLFSSSKGTGQLSEIRFDAPILGSDLLLIALIKDQRLLEHKQMLLPVVTAEGSGNLRVRCLDSFVLEEGEHVRDSLAGHNRL